MSLGILRYVLGGRPTAAELCVIPLSKIRPGRNAARSQVSDDEVLEMAETMREVGCLQPLTVQYSHDSGCYEVVAGERRLEAAMLAELDDVPCRVVSGLDERGQRQLQLIENLHRKALPAIDLARCLQDLVQSGLPQIEVAKLIGKSESFVSKAITVAETFVDETFVGQTLPLDHLHAIATLPEQDRPEVLQLAVEQGLTQKETRAAVKAKKESFVNETSTPIKRPFIREFKLAGGLFVVVSCTEKQYLPPEEVAEALRLAAAQAIPTISYGTESEAA